MVRKKIDNRIRVLIENGVSERHRTLFVIVGDKGRDQVVILHHMLSKALIKMRPSVLWCYKKELGFTSHRKKRMKQLQKKIKHGMLDVKDDPFELFISSTEIRYCYYAETHKILGNTYGMCVLQDFEALTPNLLARTVETVEGGGIIVLLLRTLTSLKSLYTMTMDVHARYRTEAHQDVVGRFNERFLLSLASCKNCMVIDDQLNLLPISTHALNVQALPPKTTTDALSDQQMELNELKESSQDTQPVGSLINHCKTLDQAKAVLKFIDSILEKTLRTTVTLTAARGRGKSAALGLAIAAAIGFGYSNIFVTSPSPENLKTLFEFVFKGFRSLKYQEHLDYELIQSTNPDFNDAIVRINVFHDHRQTIQYIHPTDGEKLGQAELVVIDEAAAIPLPLVRKLLGPYLVFMASTVNGYEGTGRSLTLKLIKQLREQNSTCSVDSSHNKVTTVTATATGRALHEITLEESIRYAEKDPVEMWLNTLLCLDVSTVHRIPSRCPVPDKCDLYYVNRDTLFCFHKASETFLQRMMSLYISSHYKNTPNDLQMMSDAPAHHLFVLLGPVDETKNALPEILCVLQVCLEGEISKQSVMNGLARGKRASGDLIPWTVSQQFQDSDFASLSGCRIVRISTHPDYQRMGYGSRALFLLQQYYEGKIPNLDETTDPDTDPSLPGEHGGDGSEITLLEERVEPRKNLPPLLLKLSERRAEEIQYLGVSFGLTSDLLKFWKRSGFTPVYLRQTQNDLTGEHSCIMLKQITDEDQINANPWLSEFHKDFSRRFVSLLSYQFRNFKPAMALNVLSDKKPKQTPQQQSIDRRGIESYFTSYDLRRLDMYARSMVDYHLIMDLLPTLARLYFINIIPVTMSAVQKALLLGIGLQHKTIDDLSTDIDLPSSQMLGLFQRLIKKIVDHLNRVVEQAVEKSMTEVPVVGMEPTKISIVEELRQAEEEIVWKQKEDLRKLKELDLSQYVVEGDDEEWSKALNKGAKNIISLKSSSEKRKSDTDLDTPKQQKQKKFKKQFKK